MTNVFLSSNSILFIRPAPVRLSINLDSLECDRLAFVRSAVILIPLTPLSSVTEMITWWKGLAKELELDIETLDDGQKRKKQF